MRFWNKKKIHLIVIYHTWQWSKFREGRREKSQKDVKNIVSSVIITNSKH